MTENEQFDQQKTALANKVKNWIETQGYSLEMRMAKKFRDAGFSVSQFEHFVDQESQSVRPVDIVASLSAKRASSKSEVAYQLVTKLFVECKYSSKDHPWIILVSSTDFGKYSFFSRTLQGFHPAEWHRIPTLQGRLIGRIAQALDSESKLDPFQIRHAGYIVKEAAVGPGSSKDRPKDHSYDAIVQISKSVEAHDIEQEQIYRASCKEIQENGQQPLSSFFFSIAFPVVIISGCLFRGEIGTDSEIKVTEIETGTVFVPYRQRETSPHASVVLSPITIVSENSIDTYLNSIRCALELLLARKREIRDVINNEQKNLPRIPAMVDF